MPGAGGATAGQGPAPERLLCPFPQLPKGEAALGTEVLDGMVGGREEGVTIAGT